MIHEIKPEVGELVMDFLGEKRIFRFNLRCLNYYAQQPGELLTGMLDETITFLLGAMVSRPDGLTRAEVGEAIDTLPRDEFAVISAMIGECLEFYPATTKRSQDAEERKKFLAQLSKSKT